MDLISLGSKEVLMPLLVMSQVDCILKGENSKLLDKDFKYK